MSGRPPAVHSRSRLQRAGSALLRNSLYRWYARHQRPNAGRLLRELHGIEFAPLEAIQALQQKRLRAHLAWACQASTYYREAAVAAGFDAAAVRSVNDLQAFPLLTKRILREQESRLLPGGEPLSSWQRNASGGSTGEPVRLYQDGGYWDASQAAQWFMEGWWGVRPGEAAGIVWGADRDLGLRSRRERAVDFIQQGRALNAFAVDEERLLAFAAMLARWQPPYLIGYASALYLLACFLQRHPELRIRPQAIKSTAEVLHGHERATIEEVFAAPVYDLYGSREVNFLAAECPAHAGLHVNTWSRVVELLDGGGKAVPPGVPGRVVVTDLTSRATPMLRYENGDVAEWSAAACPCGRPFPLLARIVGRKSDFIRSTSGKLIHGEYFTHLFYEQTAVETFQVVQTSLAEVRVEVVLRAGSLASVAAALEPAMLHVLGPGTRVRFEQVSQITRPASGKHRFTRSLVELPWPAADSREPQP